MEIKKYIDGGIDTDSDEITIEKNACVLMEGFRFGSSDVAGQGRIESVYGNTLITNPYLPTTGTNYRIGSCFDEGNQQIFVFNWNSLGLQGIYMYDLTANLWFRVLLNNQVASGLRFDKNKLIQSEVLGDNLYWIDSSNQPRKICVQAGITSNNSNIVVYGLSFSEVRSAGNVTTTLTFTSLPATTNRIDLYWRVAGASVYSLAPLSAAGVVSPLTFTPFSTTQPVEYRVHFVFVANPTTRPVVLDVAFSNTVLPYRFPLLEKELTLIVRPPHYPLSAVKVNAATIPSLSTYTQNFIKDEAMQFTLRYVYKTWERSVIGQWSQMVIRNLAAETFNVVTVTLPFAEKIPQFAGQVELIVRYGNTGKSFKVKTWETDETAIINHNNGTTALTHYFLNDQTGLPVDDVAATKPFDSIPITANVIETAKDRLFVGNGLYGYDTPATTSLTVALAAVPGVPATVAAEWHEYNIEFSDRLTPATYTATWYLLWIPSVSRYYIVAPYCNPFLNFPPPAGLVINISDPSLVVGSGTTASSAINTHPDFRAGFLILDSATYVGIFASAVTATNVPISTTTNADRALKSNSSYRTAIVFYDEHRRKCGYIQPANSSVYTAQRAYNTAAFSQTIQWTLLNTAAFSEIPDWAFYYQIVRTKNLHNAFFMQGRTLDTGYITKDATGAYPFGSLATTYASTQNGIAINISCLEGFGMGYIFTEGDLVDIHLSPTTSYTLPVIAQDGQYIVVGLKSIGTLGAGVPVIFEIYTPYKAAVNEFLYEVGECYPVTGAGTAARSYSVLTGYLNGDVSVLARVDATGTYYVEAMSPNDKYWKQWETDIGFANVIDTIGQQAEEDSFSHSNTIILGSKNNGLSSFDALNKTTLPFELGGLSKLQLTSKVQQEGTVMLGIGRYETATIYLGETQVFDQSGNSFLAKSTGVVGNVQVLKGSYGTINPESVVEEQGMVYWIDAVNGKAIQYGINGLFPISEYKTRRFWRLFGRAYSSNTISYIEALGNRPFVFGGIDPEHNEYLVTIPKVLTAPPMGYLTDYSPQIIYPYDMWDGLAKTMVFKTEQNPNRWQGAYPFAAEGFINANNRCYAFKGGQLYLQNDTAAAPCRFFGVATQPKISYIENVEQGKVKEWHNVALQSNSKPSFTHFRSERPVVQSSDLDDTEYSDKEGVYYAPIYRDRLTPGQPSVIAAGKFGDEIQCAALRVHHIFPTGVFVYINFFNTGFTMSKGHTV